MYRSATVRCAVCGLEADAVHAPDEAAALRLLPPGWTAAVHRPRDPAAALRIIRFCSLACWQRSLAAPGS